MSVAILPLPAPNEDIAPGDAGAEQVVPMGPQPRRVTRVLLVDDDVAYRLLCQRYLRRDPKNDYRVRTASTADEAAELDLAGYDCVVVDYFLPDGTGTELIERWRSSGQTDMPPVVVMSAGGGERAAIDAVRTHAIDYLAKADMTPGSLQRCVGNATEKGDLRREVRARQTELARAHAALEKRAIEIQRFYHTVSHEMKTPLTATREFVSLVNDGVAGPVTDQQRELLRYALDSCDQMTRQFHDLIDMTRLDTGKLRLEPVPLALEPLIERCIAMVGGQASQKAITLDTHWQDSPPWVLADAGRIVQVITNLLGNAIKFTPRHGQVRVRVRLRPDNRRDAGRVEICVVDNGCGIAKQSRPYVFERLYQTSRDRHVDKDNADGLGLGLGLSISREIVRAHGGELRVYSRLGAGSTFQFTLPRAEGDAAGADTPQVTEVPKRTRP